MEEGRRKRRSKNGKGERTDLTLKRRNRSVVELCPDILLIKKDSAKKKKKKVWSLSAAIKPGIHWICSEDLSFASPSDVALH